MSAVFDTWLITAAGGSVILVQLAWLHSANKSGELWTAVSCGVTAAVGARLHRWWVVGSAVTAVACGVLQIDEAPCASDTYLVWLGCYLYAIVLWPTAVLARSRALRQCSAVVATLFAALLLSETCSGTALSGLCGVILVLYYPLVELILWGARRACPETIFGPNASDLIAVDGQTLPGSDP